MGDKMGFAIIGCGNIAPFHVQGINCCPDARLVAAADTDEGQSERFLEVNPDVAIFTDYLKLLKLSEVEVVCICTPSATHTDIAIEAARAHKHIICEKPLGTDLDRIDKMIKICRANKVKLTAIARRRAYPFFCKVKEAVSGGVLGRMVFGDAYMKYYRSPSYYKNAGWRSTWDIAGGGALMNQGIHGLDLLRWIMGKVKAVCAKSGHLARNIPVDDTTVAILEFESGAYGVLQVSTSTNPGEPSRYMFHGDKGTIILSDSGIERWAVSKKPEIRAKDSPAEMLSKIEDEKKEGGSSEIPMGHAAQICDMVAAIKEDREPLVTPEDARDNVAVIQAIYESARTGKEIVLG